MGHISSAWFTFLGRGISLKFLMIADMTFTLLLLREMCAHRKTYMVPIQQDYFSTFFSSMFLVEIHHLIHSTPSSPERGKNLQNYCTSFLERIFIDGHVAVPGLSNVPLVGHRRKI